jgi:hypothetical protein
MIVVGHLNVLFTEYYRKPGRGVESKREGNNQQPFRFDQRPVLQQTAIAAI